MTDDSPTAHTSVDTPTDRVYAYEMAVERSFITQHYLTVPDPEPPEGSVHSHHYTIVVELAGPELGPYGYLLDITVLEDLLDEIEARYRDTLLNDCASFEGQNPSVERFATVIADELAPALAEEPPERLRVTVWEDDEAWARHTRPLT